MIEIYDHDNTDSGDPTRFVTKLCSAAKELKLGNEVMAVPTVEKPDIQVADELLKKTDASICFLHIDDNAWQRFLESGQKDRKFVRVSSQGLSSSFGRTEQGSYYFYVVPRHDSLEPDDWRHVLEFLTNKSLDACISQGELPDDVQKYFGAPIRYDMLPALSILCQGYLGVASEYRRQEKRVKDQGEDLKRALTDMQWDKVPHDIIEEHIGKEIADKWQEVQNPRWWDVFELWDDGGEFSERTWHAVIDRIRQEFGLGRADAREDPLTGLPENAASLLLLIKEEKLIDDVNLVARAFKEIHEQLKKHE